MKIRKLISGITSAALAVSMFAGMNLSGSGTLQADAAQANWKFDLGGGGVSSGFTGVSATDGYNASRGYGFAQTNNVANVSAGGSGAGSDAVQFKSEAGGNTFNVDLPKGLYQVKVTTGNVSRTSIKMEGMLQMINLTGLNATETIQIPVTDGQLNIQAVAGRANTQFSISAIEITQLNTTGAMNPTIWICGDSTVANYYNCADSSQHGWGQFFGSYVGNSYQVRNMASSGQYAKGFVDGGQFDAIETYGKSGDYYIISIGINDTNYSNGDEYTQVVTDMVKRAKAKGMEVILVKQQGRRGDLQRNPLLGGRWFGGQLDSIGKAENVKVVDLFTPWQNFGVSVGYDGMGDYYAIQANGNPDDLHQSKKGSMKLAELMQAELQIGVKQAIQPEEGASYMFKNVNSGLYLEVANASAEAGANVQQWGANAPADHNTWVLKQAVGDYYYFYSNLEGADTYCLYVDNGSRDNGGNIVISTNNGYSDQYFKILDNGDGTVTIVTRASRDARAVEVVNALTSAGANVQQWELNDHPCQKWVMEKVEYPEITTTTTTVTTTSTTTTTTTTTEYIPETTTAPRKPIIFGDADGSGEVTVSDIVCVLQYSANKVKYPIKDENLINADFNQDGDINAMDAYLIQQYDAGVIDAPEIVTTTTEATTTTTTTEVTTTTTTTPDPYAGYYFAVDQTWDQGIIESTNAGFTRDAYVNLDNNNTSNIVFGVDVPESGNYMTHIRFANGSANDRKMTIHVNGDTGEYWMQSFPSTGAWTEWTEYGIVLPLVAGHNTIKFASATSEGGPNLDYINLTLTDEPYAETYDPSQDEHNVSDKVTLFIAGDSTVQSYRAQYAPQQGWGYYMADYFNDTVTVDNRSIAGRSSKKFYDEGRWQSILDSSKQGDYVMVMFAINDAGASNADRYAPTCGNVNNPSSGSYEWYMTEYIKTAQAKGVTPILVTTVIGMKAYSSKNSRFENSYTNYCDACKQLASKYKIPCIDLNTLMVSHYNSVGYNTALSYHLMGAVEGSTDGTHFCEKGANVVAGIVANAVKSQNISGLSDKVK